MEEYIAIDGALAFMDKIQGHDIKALTVKLTYGLECIDNGVNVTKVAKDLSDNYVGGSMSAQTYKNVTSGSVRLLKKFKTVAAVEDAVSAHNAAATKASFNPAVLADKLVGTVTKKVTPQAAKKAAKLRASNQVASIVGASELSKAEKLAALNAGIKALG